MRRPADVGGMTTGGALASRDRGAREHEISPEFRDRVAMFGVIAFVGFISLAVLSAYIVSLLLVDWDGVAETAFRLFDLS